MKLLKIMCAVVLGSVQFIHCSNGKDVSEDKDLKGRAIMLLKDVVLREKPENEARIVGQCKTGTVTNIEKAITKFKARRNEIWKLVRCNSATGYYRYSNYSEAFGEPAYLRANKGQLLTRAEFGRTIPGPYLAGKKYLTISMLDLNKDLVRINVDDIDLYIELNVLKRVGPSTFRLSSRDYELTIDRKGRNVYVVVSRDKGDLKFIHKRLLRRFNPRKNS